MAATAHSLARRLALVLAAAGLLAVGVATPSQATGPAASASRTCSLAGSYRTLGPTYANQLRVTGTSCSTGKNVIRAWHNCRLAQGGRRGTVTAACWVSAAARSEAPALHPSWRAFTAPAGAGASATSTTRTSRRYS